MTKRSIIALFIGVSMSFVGYGQHQWKEKQAGGYTYKYVENDPTGARFYTLKNGLTVILSPTNKEPRIQGYMAVKAGSKTDPSTNTGLAHYLEHMLFKGTDKFGTLDWAKEKEQLDKIDALYEKYNKTKDEKERKKIYRDIDSVSGVASKFAIANEYDKLMAAIGAQGTNAFTSFEKTVYHDDIPSTALDKYLAVQAERFRNPILRLFHTELEAVYEEKNRSLDNDGSLVFETLFSNLFQKHNYGKQTTIGTVEHLKNPSLVEIRKYFNKYYVPNNMVFVLSGDFNPETTIAKVDKAFSYMQRKDVPVYKFEQETPLKSPIIKEVVGPDSESLTMGFRLPGNSDKDVLLADLVGAILTNGEAGLIDLNLVKKQKLLGAAAEAFILIDHGVLYLEGKPKEGQSLEEVKSLILAEIENLKKGNFDNDLIASIVNNKKKEKIQATESYSERAYMLMSAFTEQLDWKGQVEYTDLLSKVKKEDVVSFANKYLGDNYVAVLKKKGERKEAQKIEKPQITPVEMNADKQSVFLKQITEMPITPIEPVFLDYKKDMSKSKLGKAEVLYVQNKDNELYRLRFRYKVGTLNDLKLKLACDYINYLGTNKKTSEQISKEFYKIASSFSISVGEEYTTVVIEGLQENFDKAVKLYEDLVLNVKGDKDALDALKSRMNQSRQNAKANRNRIMNALTQYALYGPQNKYNYVLSDSELNAVTPDELVSRLKTLNNYEQTVIYYGPEKLNNLVAKLGKLHKVPAKFAKPAVKKEFDKIEQKENEVLFTDYNMVQSEIRWIRTTDVFEPNQLTTIKVFNNYFGGGMGSIVFQTIRESKALAYSTYGFYAKGSKKNDKNFILAYVGTQADKFQDAISSMNELLTNLPELPENFNLAKDGVIKDIQTERITQDGVIYDYLAAKELGLDRDFRKDIYNNVGNITMNDLKAFHSKYFSNKPYTYVVLASESKLPESELKKIGKVKKLSLKELFGY